MSTVDELRKASEKLRALANAASPAPWRHTDSEVVDDVFGAGLVVVGPERDPIALVCDSWYEDEDGEPTPWHDATYITTMHPGVGLALADWLDTAGADEWAHGPTCAEPCGDCDDDLAAPHIRAAIQIAGLINGDPS